MNTINKEQWYKMLTFNCGKNKHRLRTNEFGVTFCVICGLLSNSNNSIKGDESLTIKV